VRGNPADVLHGRSANDRRADLATDDGTGSGDFATE
jgi:hypothetical protein